MILFGTGGGILLICLLFAVIAKKRQSERTEPLSTHEQIQHRIAELDGISEGTEEISDQPPNSEPDPSPQSETDTEINGD